MSYRVGDVMFLNSEPSVIRAKNFAGKVTVETTPEEVEDHFRHGYISGMAGEERDNFHQVMDDIKEISEPSEKVSVLKGQIEEMQQSPEKFRLVRYLKAELSHLMMTHNIQPKSYSIPINKAP